MGFLDFLKKDRPQTAMPVVPQPPVASSAASSATPAPLPDDLWLPRPAASVGPTLPLPPQVSEPLPPMPPATPSIPAVAPLPPMPPAAPLLPSDSFSAPARQNPFVEPPLPPPALEERTVPKVEIAQPFAQETAVPMPTQKPAAQQSAEPVVQQKAEPAAQQKPDHFDLDIPDFTDDDLAVLKAPHVMPPALSAADLPRVEMPKARSDAALAEVPAGEPANAAALPSGELSGDLPSADAPVDVAPEPAKFVTANSYLMILGENKAIRRLLRQSDDVIKESLLCHEQLEQQFKRVASDVNSVQEQFIKIDSALFED